MAEKSTKGY